MQEICWVVQGRFEISEGIWTGWAGLWLVIFCWRLRADTEFCGYERRGVETTIANIHQGVHNHDPGGERTLESALISMGVRS